MRYAAIIRRNGVHDFETDCDYHRGKTLEDHKIVMVPEGESLELNDSASRPWLHHYLGSGWHLLGFMEVVA